ncbi:putative F-box protein At3g21130 [Euphorbia lathyris]|uniref:putative F-box protein At3g21130 n=1 Tax=Euphorbia lathyris TaxID=212925 RepID=UPI0033135710
MYKEDSDGILHAKEFDFPFKSFLGHGKDIPVYVSNSCDGLMCFVFSRDHKILIWNPSLPSEHKIIQSQFIANAHNVAIGYDSTSDDYKIINVSVRRSIDEVYITVEIFSFKSSSWKITRITKPESIVSFRTRFLYANNGIHWVSEVSHYEEAVEEDDFEYIYGYPKCLVYFDLAKESLNYMNLPSKSFIHLSLIQYKESIAISDHIGEQHEIWVLEKYCGMESTWKKNFRFNFTIPLGSYYSSFTLNAEILHLTWKGQLRKFDLYDGNFKPVVVHDDKVTYDEKCSYYVFVSPYVESLVSPMQL